MHPPRSFEDAVLYYTNAYLTLTTKVFMIGKCLTRNPQNTTLAIIYLRLKRLYDLGPTAVPKIGTQVVWADRASSRKKLLLVSNCASDVIDAVYFARSMSGVSVLFLAVLYALLEEVKAFMLALEELVAAEIAEKARLEVEMVMQGWKEKEPWEEVVEDVRYFEEAVWHLED